MTSWSFFEGKTVDVALKNAARELGVPIERLEYEIVFAGASGIFGLVGAKNAKIRVATAAGDASRASMITTERQEILSLVDETFAEAGTTRKEHKEHKENKEHKAQKPHKVHKPHKSAESARSTKPVEPIAPEEPTEPEEPADLEDPAEPEAPAALDAEAPEPEKVYTEADFEEGKTALSKIVESVVSEATISMQIKKNQVLFNIEGNNAAILIGKHGQTLKAMQHIVEKIVHKACGERVRVLVDVEQYMEKRRASLKSLATKLADKAKETGKPTTINHMDAFERKIIHDTLRKDRHVKTRSAGGGEMRNIVIHPGKKGGRPKKASGK
jgi:spoIIIJ-associated protein